MAIKAIDTYYRGYMFRSRLEARWAVFFDAMRHQWAYEEEGFELPSGRYLPDFHITDFDVWVEIKPAITWTEEPDRPLEIGTEMHVAGKPFIMFCGDPLDVFGSWTGWPTNTKGHPKDWTFNDDEFKHPGMWCPTPMPAAKQLLFVCTFLQRKDRTLAAAQRARAARFEHGAKP